MEAEWKAEWICGGLKPRYSAFNYLFPLLCFIHNSTVNFSLALPLPKENEFCKDLWRGDQKMLVGERQRVPYTKYFWVKRSGASHRAASFGAHRCWQLRLCCSVIYNHFPSKCGHSDRASLKEGDAAAWKHLNWCYDGLVPMGWHQYSKNRSKVV